MDMSKTPAAILLPLHHDDLFVLLGALGAFYDAEKATGDTIGYGEQAWQIIERLHALKPLVTHDADQMLRSVGLGSYKDRPQG
jgi:hypothetical protein